MDNTLYVKIKKSITFVSLGSFGQKIIIFLFTPLMVRILGQDQFGNYASVLAIINLLMVFSNFGQADAIRKYLPQIRTKSKDKQISFFYGAISITLILVIMTLLVGLLFIKVDSIDIINRFFYYILSIMVISIVFKNFQSILFGLHFQDVSEPLKLLNYLIYYGVGLLLAYLGYSVEGILLAFVLGMLVTSLIMFFIILKFIKREFSYTFKFNNLLRGLKEYSIPLLRFGRWIVIGSLFAQLLYQADIIMVKYFLSAKDAALYKAALSLAQFLWIIPQIIQQALIPSFAELWVNKNVKKINRISSKIFKFVFLGLVLPGGGLFILSQPFISIYYGMEYTPAVLPLKILIIGSLGYGISRVTSPIFQAANQLKLTVISSFIATILNLVINFYLIPRIGINGAAIGTSISYFSLFITKYWYINKLGIRFSVNVDKLFGLLVLYIPILYVISIIFEAYLLKIIFTSLFGLILFLILSLILKIVDMKEIKNIVLRRGKVYGK